MQYPELHLELLAVQQNTEAKWKMSAWPLLLINKHWDEAGLHGFLSLLHGIISIIFSATHVTLGNIKSGST